MSGAIRVLELRSVRGTGGGPEKTILMGAQRSNPTRLQVSVCYLRDERDDVFGIDVRARSLGVDYVEIRERHSFDFAIWRALRRLVRERGIDIVHAHDYKTNLLALLLARAEPVIAMSTVHGWSGDTWRERLVYYPADKRLLGRLPCVIAVSTKIKELLVRHGASPDRVRIVLNGIDHRQYQRDRSREPDVRRTLGLQPQDVVLGAVGRLGREKRFDLLVEAFARLRPGRPHLRLLIVGEGDDRPRIEQAMRALGVEAGCRLLGHREDILNLHHAFDLFVQSSDTEGTPNAVLEAMAMETPVVATDVGGTCELIRQESEGLIVPPSDPAALAAAIARALGDREASERRYMAARRRVERTLSFDARMRTLEATYEELIDARDRQHSRAPWLRPA
jgi:glycosyltransferase involved in cell wall biosynthesis